jgi:hypothetical protein
MQIYSSQPRPKVFIEVADESEDEMFEDAENLPPQQPQQYQVVDMDEKEEDDEMGGQDEEGDDEEEAEEMDVAEGEDLGGEGVAEDSEDDEDEEDDDEDEDDDAASVDIVRSSFLSGHRATDFRLPGWH